MTLDEAIKHAEEVADEKKKEACNLYDVKNYEESRECIWCSEEHRQLAEWLKDYKRLLEQEPSDTVSRGAFEQVIWERDVAIGQLEKLGYGLGQKVEPCDDAVSRKAVDELSKELVHTTRDKADFLCNFWEGLQKLPPVTPQKKSGNGY